MKLQEIHDPNEAIKTAATIILAANPRGMRNERELKASVEEGDGVSGDYLNVSFERGWAIGCSLSINMTHSDSETDKKAGMRRELRAAQVEVSWSSTGRSAASARAAIALYSEITDLAAEIESVLGERVYGKETEL